MACAASLRRRLITGYMLNSEKIWHKKRLTKETPMGPIGVGVYPLDYDMFYILEEAYHGVSNRDLLYDFIAAPLYAIRESLLAGKQHPFVLRERHRAWTERVENLMGTTYLPTWEEIIEDPDSSSEYLYEILYSDPSEWTLFGDDLDMAYEVFDKLPADVLVSGDPVKICREILRRFPHIQDLLLVSTDDDSIYVLRSPETGMCDIDDATEEGDTETFVLPRDVVLSYLDLMEAQA